MARTSLVFRRIRLRNGHSDCAIVLRRSPRLRLYSFSLLCSVFRLTPRISAARVLFCPVASSVRRISSRSASSTVAPTLHSDRRCRRIRAVAAVLRPCRSPAADAPHRAARRPGKESLPARWHCAARAHCPASCRPSAARASRPTHRKPCRPCFWFISAPWPRPWPADPPCGRAAAACECGRH